MRGSSHAILGLSAAALVAVVARDHPHVGIPMAMGTVIGSLIPDVDSPGSFYLEQVARRMASRGDLVRRFAGILILGVILPLRLMVLVLGMPHRGPLHRPTFAAFWIVIGFPLLAISASIGAILMGVGIGVLVHLAADSITPGGIEWFGKRIRGPVRTGSTMEMGIVSLVVLFSALIIFVLIRSP